ncbi:hypothetical protein Ahy_B02g057224 [Arachis hypogaea]|uniref:MULE transposase domain-containing protein n=1 Tax=Arachis hypogaea TaxID=3818 RepID=A0A445ABA1_ARAHY|nr:hypothetical protein Ahy_B02g057224 [Arachis hypogaea]
MLPIAYVVFETETYNSLIWFLRHLVEDLELEKIRKCTFMSDQQKNVAVCKGNSLEGLGEGNEISETCNDGEF